MVQEKMTVETQTPSGALVAKGASFLFTQGLGASVSSFLFLTIATRILSISNIGAVSAVGMIGTLFTTVGTLAIPSGVTRYISMYLGRSEQNTAKEIITKSLRFGFLASLLISFGCLASSGLISSLILHDPVLQSVIMVLAFDVGALVFNSFLSGTLFGLQKFRLIAFIGIITSALKLLGATCFLFLGLSLQGIVIGWVVADLTATSLLLFFVSKSFGKIKSSDGFSYGEILRYSFPLYVASIIGYFSTTIDKLVVLSLSDLAVLGVYSVAVAAVSTVGMVSDSIGASLFPQLVHVHGQYGEDALKEASVKTSRYVFLIFMPLAIGLAATAYPIIQLFFGESYTSGSLPVVIVSVVVALTSAVVIVNNLLLSLGKTRVILEASAISVTVGAAFSAFLVSSLGSTGAAIGRAALLSASFAYSAYRLRKAFGLYFDMDAFKMSLVCSVTMVVSVIAAQLLLMVKYMLPLYITVGAAVYFLMLRFLKVLNNQDAQLLKEVLPTRFQRLTNIFNWFFSLGN
jgi:O-antigen/teichoic acid export membrane protein